MDPAELKPCPFCGGGPEPRMLSGIELQVTSQPLVEELSNGLWRVICYLCCATVTQSNRLDSIARWNQRATFGASWRGGMRGWGPSESMVG